MKFGTAFISICAKCHTARSRSSFKVICFENDPPATAMTKLKRWLLCKYLDTAPKQRLR